MSDNTSRTITIDEIVTGPSATATKWPRNDARLAILVDVAMGRSGYMVGGPVTAQFFAAMSSLAELSYKEVAVPAISLPREPLLQRTQLHQMGYLIVCGNGFQLTGQAMLVILNSEWARRQKELARELQDLADAIPKERDMR